MDTIAKTATIYKMNGTHKKEQTDKEGKEDVKGQKEETVRYVSFHLANLGRTYNLGIHQKEQIQLNPTRIVTIPPQPRSDYLLK
jgi:hypothetical protein